MMEEDQVPSQKKNGEYPVRPSNNDDQENPSPNKYGENRTTRNKKEADNRKLPNKPYAEVSWFEQTDSVTLFTKRLQGCH